MVQSPLRNQRRRPRRLQQPLRRQIIRIRKTRPLSRKHPHAATHTEKGSLGRVGLLVVLVAGNFVAGFLYYFLHVVWREDRPSSISV